MAYADLDDNEGVRAEYLAVLKPAREVTSWTNTTLNIQTNSFDYGRAVAVTIDGVEQTLISSANVSSGEFYWANNILYINDSSPSTKYIVVTYELYIATFGAHFNRIPTDTTTTEVYYEPIIIKPPVMKESLESVFYGFMPSQSSSIVLNNGEHSLEKHLYDSSFKNKEIKLYHWLDDLKTANVKLVLRGLTDNISYSSSQVTINIVDNVDIFNTEFRNDTDSFYTASNFPNITPSSKNRPIRYFYGVVNSLININLDENIDTPTTSNNRIWSVREGTLNQISTLVPASPSSTTTRTYVASTTGLVIGDTIWINKATDEYKEITAVGINYVEHSALVSGAASTSDSVNRGTVAYINYFQNDKRYKLFFTRDYTESVINNVVCYTLTSSAESNAGSSTLEGFELLNCRAYGETNTNTIGGGAFGSDSATYGCLVDPAVIMYELIKSKLGIAESDIDTTSFQTLQSEIGSESISFAIPKVFSSDFPSYKTLLTDIMSSNFVQLFKNSDQKWEVLRFKPLTTENKQIANDEIIINSINYNINYKDLISDIIVNYKYQESSDSYENENYVSETAKYLHGIKKQKSFNSVLLESSDADTLAKRLGFLFGDRLGKFKLNTKNRFFDSQIGDIIEVNLEKMLGFDYESGTLRTRKYRVIGIDRGLRLVSLTLDDQKGIEDNSDDF